MKLNKFLIFVCVFLLSRLAVAYPICFSNAKILGFVPDFSFSGAYYRIGSNATFSGVSVSKSGCLEISVSNVNNPTETPSNQNVLDFVKNNMSQTHVDWSQYNISSSTGDSEIMPDKLSFAVAGELWIEFGNLMLSCNNVQFGQSINMRNSTIERWMFANQNSYDSKNPSLYCKTNQGGSSYISFYYSMQNGGGFNLQLK